MTDKELLAICQTAFEAIPVANRAHKVLRQLDLRPEYYAGDPRRILSAEVARMIDKHLNGGL